MHQQMRIHDRPSALDQQKFDQRKIQLKNFHTSSNIMQIDKASILLTDSGS